jgi:hypothetical protein
LILIVDLQKEQTDDALRIAHQRNDGKPQGKAFSSKHSELGIHYMSALAEVAWEQVTGWPVDREHRMGGDDGVDFVHKDRFYQIKARDANGYRDPDLLVRTSHAQADRFILAEVDIDLAQVSFIGWCSRNELLQNIIDLPGKGKRYIRHRGLLRDIPIEIII